VQSIFEFYIGRPVAYLFICFSWWTLFDVYGCKY